MSQQKVYRRRIRWGRIAAALLLLGLLLFGLIKGLSALFAGGKKTDKNPSSASESVSSAESESVPVQPAVDLSQWNLVLVNAAHKLPDSFTVETGTLTNGLEVDARILEDLNAMVDAAAAENVDLIICSAYRTIEVQTDLFNEKVAEYTADGYSQADAESEAGTIVALPGTSEHNTGLAVDIVTPAYQMLDDGYAETDAAKWLAAHAPEYGFILRYPQGKEDVTGIIFEPWHYRYVGREYARTITDSGLCLEEWIAAQQG